MKPIAAEQSAQGFERPLPVIPRLCPPINRAGLVPRSFETNRAAENPAFVVV